MVEEYNDDDDNDDNDDDGGCVTYDDSTSSLGVLARSELSVTTGTRGGGEGGRHHIYSCVCMKVRKYEWWSLLPSDRTSQGSRLSTQVLKYLS